MLGLRVWGCASHQWNRAEATVAAHAPSERVERLVFALKTAARQRYWDAAGTRVAQWLRERGVG